MTATLVNGFDPQLGNAFPIIEGTGVNGTFSTTNLPTLDPGLSWQVQYNPNNVTLLVVAAGVPEPGSALALASAAGVLLLRRRR
jgi:hypothetical protein